MAGRGRNSKYLSKYFFTPRKRSSHDSFCDLFSRGSIDFEAQQELFSHVSARLSLPAQASCESSLTLIEHTNKPGILVSLDQEKAFDRVNRSFSLNLLKLFGFGPWFLHVHFYSF